MPAFRLAAPGLAGTLQIMTKQALLHRPRPTCLRAALGLAFALATGLATPQAAAQQRAAGGTLATIGAGSSDYGTAIVGQLSGPLSLGFLPPVLNRWEAQLASWGSENYAQFGNIYKRSAWSLGASVTPQWAITPSLAAFGKVGLHYLNSEAKGPGLAETKRGAELGLGVGLRWQAQPNMALKLELQNVGGGRGDLITLGLQFAL